MPEKRCKYELSAQITGLHTLADQNLSEQQYGALNAARVSPDEVFVFEAVVSSDTLSSKWTKMTDKSLSNFVEDGKKGSPLLPGHDYGRLNFGKSFDARLVEDDTGKKVVFSDFMLKDHEIDGIKTNDLARAIAAGIITDLSISFGGPDISMTCSVCGRDIWDWDCRHLAGEIYDGVLAYYVVDNARALEHSLVFAGADPSAVILGKLNRQFKDGELDEETFRRLSNAYSTGSSIRTDLADIRETKPMTVKEALSTIRAHLETSKLSTGPLADLPVEEDELQAFSEFLCQLSTDSAELAALKSAGVASVEEAKQLIGCRELVTSLTEEMVQEVLAEGVRAHGEGFNQSLWENIVKGRSLSELKVLREEFRAVAKQRLGKDGRQVEPPTKPELSAIQQLTQDYSKLSTEERAEFVANFLEKTGGKPVASPKS